MGGMTIGAGPQANGAMRELIGSNLLVMAFQAELVLTVGRCIQEKRVV